MCPTLCVHPHSLCCRRLRDAPGLVRSVSTLQIAVSCRTCFTRPLRSPRHYGGRSRGVLFPSPRSRVVCPRLQPYRSSFRCLPGSSADVLLSRPDCPYAITTVDWRTEGLSVPTLIQPLGWSAVSFLELLYFPLCLELCMFSRTAWPRIFLSFSWLEWGELQ